LKSQRTSYWTAIYVFLLLELLTLYWIGKRNILQRKVERERDAKQERDTKHHAHCLIPFDYFLVCFVWKLWSQRVARLVQNSWAQAVFLLQSS
jgi:hypothetical protein